MVLFWCRYIIKKIKELYGKNANIIYESFSPSSMGVEEYAYKNGKYQYSYGGHGILVSPVSKITEATTDNEKNIYDKFVFIVEEPQNTKYSIYTNCEQKNKVEEIDMETAGKIDDVEKYVLEKYSDKMTTYKHTFKKDENGNYYWYSTEPVEEK